MGAIVMLALGVLCAVVADPYVGVVKCNIEIFQRVVWCKRPLNSF